MFAYINELAVFVVAILAVAVGNIWYSPLLFGKVWMRSLGKTSQELDFTKKEMYVATGKALFVNSIFFSVLALGIAFVDIEIPLFNVGVLLFILLLSYTAGIAVWEKKPLVYILIHAGYIAITLFGGMGVIMYWPW